MRKIALLIICFLFTVAFIGCEKKDESEIILSSKVETQQESAENNIIIEPDKDIEESASPAIAYLSSELENINKINTFQISNVDDYNIYIDKSNTIMLDDENLLNVSITDNLDGSYSVTFYNILPNKENPNIARVSEQSVEHTGNLIAFNDGFALVNTYNIEYTLFNSNFNITDYKRIELSKSVLGIVYSNDLAKAAYCEIIYDVDNTDNSTITNRIYVVDISSSETYLAFEKIEILNLETDSDENLLYPLAFTNDGESLVYYNVLAYMGEQTEGGGIIDLKTSEIKTYDTSQIPEPNNYGLKINQVVFGSTEDLVWLTNWIMGGEWDYQVNGILDLSTGEHKNLPFHGEFAHLLNRAPEETGLEISLASNSPTLICTYSSGLFLYDINTGLSTLVLKSIPQSVTPNIILLSPSKKILINISESDNNLMVDVISNVTEHNTTKIDIDNDGTMEAVVYNVYEKRFDIYKDDQLLYTNNATDLDIRYNSAWGRGGQGYLFTSYNGENYIKILSYIPSLGGDGTDRVLFYKFSGNKWVKIEEVTHNLGENICTINDTVVSDEEMKNAVAKYTDIDGTEYIIDVYK